MAQAAGEAPDLEAQQWGSEPWPDYEKEAAAAAAATEKRKAKKWRCSECGKEHAEFALVKPRGGGYACVASCGLVEGARRRAAKRPHDT